MAQRLLRVIVPSGELERLREIVREQGVRAAWEASSGEGRAVVEVVVPAEGNEPLLDALEDAFAGCEGFRLILLPLAATIPRPESEEPGGEGEDGDGGAGDREEKPASGEEDGAPAGAASVLSGAPSSLSAPGAPVGGGPRDEPPEEEGEAEPPPRISREELYSDITDIAGLSVYHVAMVALSAVVASVGLVRDSSAVVVGAMVIAPLLGPNMALALATTLGDVDLAKEALRTGLVGLGVALVISVAWGAVADVDPSGRELTRVTRVGYSEIALALAAGAAGVLSVSRGTATALVGVMVAVALLPPLVAAGLLLGSGFVGGATGAFTVVAANVICINLAGVVTFLLQGVRPRTWWEEDRARRATRVALVFWALLLVGLIFVIQEAHGG